MSKYAYSPPKHPPQSVDELPRHENVGTLFEGVGTIDQAPAVIRAEDGVALSMEEYYRSQIALLDIVSGINQRAGFEQASKVSQTIEKRYGERLPSVAKGSRTRAAELAHVDFPNEYRAVPLIEAGFDSQDVMDDVVIMRGQLRNKFNGTQNKEDRRIRRQELKKKLAALAASQTTP